VRKIFSYPETVRDIYVSSNIISNENKSDLKELEGAQNRGWELNALGNGEALSLTVSGKSQSRRSFSPSSAPFQYLLWEISWSGATQTWIPVLSSHGQVPRT